MATIYDALLNAEYNLCEAPPNVVSRAFGSNQLHNAIVLLGKGYGIKDDIDELVETHPNIEDAPQKQQ